ncbi:AraC family transcriptional regulator [Chryseobacterium ginsengisoli]|uniref:AraC family transcriptional regulator n=1 Tax=Chryseobacterium ginsengisoli TaxID=363853 RepID=A0ABP9LW14_9FLAO
MMKPKNKLRHFHTISEMQQELGLPKPWHPLISMLNYKDVKITGEMLATNFVMDFYNITYNESAGCSMRYGQTTYDFNEGGMFFTSPGQPLAGVQSIDSALGFTLLIHPDFFRNYNLNHKIKTYGFFSYSVTESLHLSDKEKNIITTIAAIIEDELKTAIDDLSQDVMIAQLELLLNYSQRFYKRQFITRKIMNNDLLNRLDHALDQYFNQEISAVNGLPTVQYLSEELKVSPRYLGDMLRMFTGHNTQQHIHLKLIEKAKERLTTTNLSVTEIAYELGFEHSQSFSKLFKSKTSLSPLEFRQSFN